MSDKLINSKELGEQLGLPLQSIWRLAREGIIPSYQVGRLYRFDLVAVLDSLRSLGEDVDNM